MTRRASPADVLRGSSRVPAPLTRDEPLRTSAWEASDAPVSCYRRPLKISQAAQAHYVWVRASEVIWSEYARIISVLTDAK